MRARVAGTFILLASAILLGAQQAAPPLKVGKVDFANSCNAAAQPVFMRAVALLHSFEFRDASNAFSETLKADSTCGIAYWGLSLTAWGNPFAIGAKPEAALRRGDDAILRARSFANISPREKAYIAAAGNLYDNFSTIDQAMRVKAYSDAMARLQTKYSGDVEAKIFYALALAFSADPADKTYANQLKAGAILEKLVAKYPEHPGLAHYIIHTYDIPALAGRALNAANRYAVIAPSAPHALHMPSHTFTRIGKWQQSINTNAASVAAARRVSSPAEELHASDYMMYAFLQTGQDRAAKQLVDSLPAVIARFDPTKVTGAAPATAGYFAIAAIPARYALERGRWRDAASLELRPSPTPWANSVTNFARALGAARSGDTAVARSEIAELGRIRDQLAAQKETYWTEQTEIQIRDASAWLALAQGKNAEALATMRNATARESATEKSAISPGPLAPARELLGEMLLQVNQPREALKEFEETLKHEPNRYRTLAGAVKAASASGDRATARKYYAQLKKVTAGGDRPGRPMN